MVNTSAWHAGSLGSIGRHSIFGVKTWLSTLGILNRLITLMSVPSQFGRKKETMRTTSTLAVIILSASIERSLGVNVLKKTD